MPKEFYVYIMTNRPSGVLYIGVTSNLIQRVHQHRIGAVDGFTKRYNLKRLVWFEQHASAEAAILCERRMKEWQRAWKTKRIEALNPDWHDLYAQIASVSH